MEYALTLVIAAGLGIIPGKIAEKKGHSFWMWWFYGWMLFIVAIIHVQFIDDKTKIEEIRKAKEEEKRIAAPDQLLKYKKLLDEGAISEQEYQTIKKQILNY